MPLIKPSKDEEQDAFIARCMSDEGMKTEYPDDKQRSAVCYSQWENKDKEKDSEKILQSGPVEYRMWPKTEIRADGTKEVRLVGYAALFDSYSEEFMGMRERIERGAFKESIETDDVRMLWNHDPSYLLARNTSGTLTLKEDSTGLYFEAIPPDTQWGRDLVTLIRRGDVRENSFGFAVLKDDWAKEENMETRILQKVKLYDVSAVTYPAYRDTTITVRKGGNMYQFRSPIMFGLTANPAAYLVNNPTQGKEDKETKSDIVIPKPDESIVSAAKWADILDKKRRFQK